METASNFSEDSLPSFVSLPSLSLLHDQLTEWATSDEAPSALYTPIIDLSTGCAGKVKKMYKKKKGNKIVVLKEFPVQNDPRECEHFVKELFMGLFMRRKELLTWSDYFYHKNVRRPRRDCATYSAKLDAI